MSVVAGCLGVLVTLTGQAPQWSTYGIGLAGALFLPLAYGCAGLYRIIDMHPAEELRRMVTTTLLVGATAAVVSVAWSSPYAAWIALFGGCAALIVPASRVLGRILLAQTTWWGVPVVVIGAGAHGDAVIATLERWPELGLRPVAQREEDGEGHNSIQGGIDMPHGGARTDKADTTHAVSPDQALALARAQDVPYAIMAMPSLSYYDRARMISHIGKFFRRLYVVPEGLNPIALWTARSASQGLMGISMKHFQLSTGARAFKRVLDIFGAVLGLILLAPLIAIIAALIKYDSPGPIFFTQDRMGLGGRCFTVLKFRTMYTDAEAKLNAILDADPARRAQYEKYHKLDEDPRVTRVGRWLRRLSLDELPQLWNVLRGDMSLVGPRAYMPGELPKMNGLSRSVLQCPPGLTGLWQVSGRNNVDFSTRVDLDVHYMQNWTVWLDMYILLRTLPVVLSGEGAK